MRVTNSGKFARYYPKAVTTRVAIFSLVLAILMGLMVSERVFAQQAKWIWNSQEINGNMPLGSVHFRKNFSLPSPVMAELVMAADDDFQVYFNNELVGFGSGFEKLTKIDLTPYLNDGENLLAIRATNMDGNTAAMAAIARFRLEGETAWRWLATDESWTCMKRVDPDWKTLEYDDKNWLASQTLGAFGTTFPWDQARMEKSKLQAGLAAVNPDLSKQNQRPAPDPYGALARLKTKTGTASTTKQLTGQTEQTEQMPAIMAPRNVAQSNPDSLPSVSTGSTTRDTTTDSNGTQWAQSIKMQNTRTAEPENTAALNSPANSKTPLLEFDIPEDKPRTLMLPAGKVAAGTTKAAEPQIDTPTAETKPPNELAAKNSKNILASTQTLPNQPATKPVSSAAPKSENAEREFTVPENFVVQQVLDGSVGSLIAMEFNEFGQLIISREGGKLLLADLSDAETGKVTVRQCCESMENVQGILPLNGDIFVTGDGPDGLGLYRLTDKDRNGIYEAGSKLVGFKGELGEHGPHGLTLGPDGMLYVMIGNASGIEGEVHPDSPSTHFYEGALLPRLEDPGGHATGVKAPGGTIVRISVDGTRREIFASGIRNSYDLAFNAKGDLFFHDSDMESDIGTPWYRPTQVFHATAGGEYGWRSGTAKFPGYYIDNIPGLVETGRGSPTGSVVYDHVMMPIRYHGALFLGDWSEGRILAVRMKPDGDSYTAEAETFLSAEPLTVTDLAVGPDGALYFTTGGRGTSGGVYRVAWEGQVPDEFRLLKDKLSQLVDRPQPQAAWTRQELAKLKTFMGDEWAPTLQGILMESRNDPGFRLRALEIMGLYGPKPTDAMLETLASDKDSTIRERAINAISWRTGPELAQVVIQALDDESPRIRRTACEALRHMGQSTNWTNYIQSLGSTSRSEAIAARRLLESTPTDQWRDSILEVEDIEVFMQGAISLMVVEPEVQNSYRILARVSAAMDGFLNDRQFLDMLRVTQLALDLGNVDPEKIPVFHDRILAEFPSGNGMLNRELSRIIGYLKDDRVAGTMEEYLSESSDSDLDKLQVILNFNSIASEFNDKQRMAVITFVEKMKTAKAVNESNYSLYLTTILNSWSSEVSESQVSEILKNGAQWPSAALSALYKLPEQLTVEQVEWISDMDRKLKDRTDSTALQARIGCIAVLGRSADDKSMYYLRQVWRHEQSRRNDVVLALAQKPDGPNWPYLISSLGELNDDTAGEVLAQLATVNKSPKEPKFLRDAITTGYRLRSTGAQSTNTLLQHWTGQQVEESDWQSTIQAWADWFNERYPDEQPISFEDQQTIGNYSVDEVLTYMESANRPAEIHTGMQAFQKAQCTQCHRFNGIGEAMGPDLSSIARRFSKRETLRSILHPSEVVPSQYVSKKVLTTDGKQYLGIVSDAGTGSIMVLTDAGEKITLSAVDVDQVLDTEVSSMPNGLLDELSLEEINDLISFMYSQTQKTADARNEDGGSSR